MDPTAEAFGHGARIFDLAFHPTLRNVIASASEDMTARIWSLQPGSDAYKQIKCCRGHEAEVLRVQWSEDGNTLATGSADGIVSLWGAKLDEAGGSYSAEEVARIPGHPEEVYAIEFIKGKPSQVLTGSGECLFLWDSEAGSLLHMVQAESGAFVEGPEGPEPLPAYIFCLAQHPDGNTFATSCSDGVLRVWALADDKLSLLHELGLHQTLGTASAFSTDGKLLFSASKNGDFVLMEYPSYNLLARGAMDHAVMSCCFFSTGGKQWLATAGSEEGIKLYDLLALSGTTQRCISCSSFPGTFLAVAVSPDGSTLAAAGDAVPLSLVGALKQGRQSSAEGASPAADAPSDAGAAGSSKQQCGDKDAASSSPAAAAVAAAAATGGARRRRGAARAPAAAGGLAAGAAAVASSDALQVSKDLQGLQLADAAAGASPQQQATDADDLFGSFSLASSSSQQDHFTNIVASNAAPVVIQDAGAAGAAAGGTSSTAGDAAKQGQQGADGGEDGPAGAGMGMAPDHHGEHNGPAMRAPVYVWQLGA